MSNISFSRPITSYSKVRKWISSIIRSKKFQVSKKWDHKMYLDVGCGPNTRDNYVNLDYDWHPTIDLCWDIVKHKYPFGEGRFQGIYTEHCLEHLTMEATEANIKEFYRMLKPGGTVRIVVPDGEI